MIPAIFIFGIGLWMKIARVRLSVAGWLGLYWLIAVWFFTYASHLTSGFVSSDEVFFASSENHDLFSNRMLWLLLNQITGLFTDELINTMRVLNLGFVILLYIVAVRGFLTFHPFTIALSLSYVSCVAALNLRDSAILLGVALFLLKRGECGDSLAEQSRALWKCRWSVLFLSMLRPVQASLFLLAGLRLYMLTIVIVVAVVFLQSPLGTQYFYNLSYHTQNFSESVSHRAEGKELSSTEPTPRNIAFWTGRFVFAPTPKSALMRLFFKAEGYPYGSVDLGVRVISRIALYSLFMAILVYALREPRIVYKTFRGHSFVLKFGFLYSLLYAVFNFGASHERIKVALLLLAIYMVDRIRRDIQKYSRK